MLGITFNGRHSYRDFGVTIAPGKVIGIPDKNKIKVTVPFSNIEYDFSDLYGEETFTPRTLTYPFNIYKKAPGKPQMNSQKTQIINWLMSGSGKQKLYDDSFPGYYFLAEVEGSSSFEEDYDTGILTVQFTADPFMIAEHPEGHDIWDIFNFDIDIAQTTDFNINGFINATLYNTGTQKLVPTIRTSDQMTIFKSGTFYPFPAGTNKNSNFILFPGENTMTINGSGSISFEFYKELI